LEIFRKVQRSNKLYEFGLGRLRKMDSVVVIPVQSGIILNLILLFNIIHKEKRFFESDLLPIVIFIADKIIKVINLQAI
jgi:hypothetical protein